MTTASALAVGQVPPNFSELPLVPSMREKQHQKAQEVPTCLHHSLLTAYLCLAAVRSRAGLGQLESQLSAGDWYLGACFPVALAPLTVLSLTPQRLQPWGPLFLPLEQVSRSLQAFAHMWGID